jgi:hypothetical protein
MRLLDEEEKNKDAEGAAIKASRGVEGGYVEGNGSQKNRSLVCRQSYLECRTIVFLVHSLLKLKLLRMIMKP